MPLFLSRRAWLAHLFTAFSLVACGDAGAPRIDGPGVGADPTGVDAAPKKDAGPDGPDYRDPKQVDAGCAAPNLVCGGNCTVVDSDRANCGACGAACAGGDSVCNFGKCACGIGKDYCDGVGCVLDLMTNFDHCGSCAVACDPNNDESCTAGACVPNPP